MAGTSRSLDLQVAIHNERVKLVSNVVSAVSVLVFGLVGIEPFIAYLSGEPGASELIAPGGIATAILLAWAGWGFLGRMEEP